MPRVLARELHALERSWVRASSCSREKPTWFSEVFEVAPPKSNMINDRGDRPGKEHTQCITRKDPQYGKPNERPENSNGSYNLFRHRLSASKPSWQIRQFKKDLGHGFRAVLQQIRQSDGGMDSHGNVHSTFDKCCLKFRGAAAESHWGWQDDRLYDKLKNAQNPSSFFLYAGLTLG